MEKWEEIFAGVIPPGKYETELINGEKKGLVIKLESRSNTVILNFGIVQAVRMLDEGIVQNNLYAEKEIKKFKKNEFKNVIYKLTEGQFWGDIENIADGYADTLDVKHYVLITQNYNIDIITEGAPEIYVL